MIGNFLSKPKQKRTRFAPSPTGCLHLGHVLSALYVWGVGRSLSAEIILRMEDHDGTRARRLYEESILKDLEWLGFVPDDGVSIVDKPSAFRQSDCLPAYEKAAQSLTKQNQLYLCTCSRKEISAGARLDHVGDAAELFYPGTCRTAKHPPSKAHGVRYIISDKVETFDDLCLGKQAQQPAKQCGDMLIKDRHGYWTYNFAVAIDDLDQSIDLIVRGQDLTHATGRQLNLRHTLSPQANDLIFFHHPLILEASGKKLSKRNHSNAIATAREDGGDPRRVLWEAALAVGLISKDEPLRELHYYLELIQTLLKP